MNKYLYMVNPRIPLKLCGETIRRSKNLELNKEEVKFALKHGPVYRKFDARTMERVTLQNIDKLHVKTKGEIVETIEEVIAPLTGGLTTEDETVDISKGETLIPDTIKPETEDENEEVVDNMEINSPEQLDEEIEVVVVNNEETEVETVEVIVNNEETEVETVEVVQEQQPEKSQSFHQQSRNNNGYYRKKKRNR